VLQGLVGLWCGSNGSLVGAWDPASIFRHVNTPSRQHIMSTPSAFGTTSQLTQLQGCTDSNPSLFSAMDVVPDESQFAAKVVVTWLLLFVGYGVYLKCKPGKGFWKF